ncbi:hypothetical protein RhiirA1_443768 [Rhizophagus irregularis]|uniref:Uncharacterized protein n=6 Tax=Rhizophagus irregularis TaxID=588596 RepID=A0A2N0RHA7_9GLOM|nr:hypothetical protein GLOIN_2v1717897 [Rhizophagus irregularis DAOM 181602=DAOM 197198]EXX75899.1 hypothetical protein RirG_037890 [Rhizophagus irregularis DAOM 197198w]PKC62684.1 hypothetical protein RhiirA1_443768 [Rhizophagus irregularis]POG59901.1 hypothetical protein GLOIN_2v1717897 [Rhizophagus irregularis DAOM 181602=DAOM 197198]UZO20887.1 hypothetical protein OCT59_013297 [Rhizophagus irregularis]CAB4398747.1 unnamed protein product [Rhizophagus irregularis]|eukprot:XP_025166767.1 hypothetical protein GLOIN_2v1717897 [Rhizophagus irregularis DAOM 181602=DAOM 197198]
MNKLILLTLFLTLITVSAAMPANDKLADLFYKRNNCKCETAFSSFDSSSSSGPFRGFVSFGQDESGSTTIFGAFNRGFNPDCFYEFLIENENGKVLYNVTRGLNVQIKSDGSTEAFTHKFKNINLNCHSNGILLGGSNMRDSVSYCSNKKFVVKTDNQHAAKKICT